MITPIILQYILNWNLANISIYGIYLMIYLIVQFILAVLNNQKYSEGNENNGNAKEMDHENIKLFNTLIIAYKENPEYFKKCLETFKIGCLLSNNFNKIIVIIDGNEQDDMYLVDIFKEVFVNNSMYINLNNTQNANQELEIALPKMAEYKYICITQPHANKRSALYTGFKLSILEKTYLLKNIDGILCTDSDTWIEESGPKFMFEALQDFNCGALTGNLGIFNKYDSAITFLSSIRYWYAFNLERAYQSFKGCVMCVSGPLGMYKLDSVEKILDEWYDQTFLGKRCTYGDDRHMTNKILGLGKRVLYTPIVNAYTETPSTIMRFFKQQTRWNRSANRELIWNIKYLNTNNMSMIIDLIYMFFYPLIVVGYLLYILYGGTLFELGIYISIVIGIGLIKGIYGIIISKNFEHIFYMTYTFIYLTCIIPARIWALLTLRSNTWGTSPRNTNTITNTSTNNKIKIDIEILPIILWNLIIIGGVCYNIYRTLQKELIYTEILLTSISSGIWVIMIITTYLYVLIKHRNDVNIKNNKKII